MRFSICLIEPEGYKFSHFLYDFCKYLCFTIEANGHECCMVKNKYYSNRINIILGSHNLKDPAGIEQIKRAGKYVIVQSEVLREGGIAGWPDQPTFHTLYVPLMQHSSAVWDGIEENHSHLQKLGIQAQRIPRFGYLPALEEVVHKKNKDIDFLYYGSLTPHRIKLIDQLKALGGNVVCIFDEAAIFRNDYIARTRVHLAPNQTPGINYINSRILYLLNNHAVVVAERCRDQEWIEHCFPSSDAEGWANLCMETLQRPDLDQLADEYFEHYKKLDMSDLFQPLLNKLLVDRKAISKLDKLLFDRKEISKAESSTNTERQKLSNVDVSADTSLLPRFKEDKAISGLTSIIMLTQNRLDHTKKCIESIRMHTLEPHEIIFVESGATDSTMKWVKRLVRENKNYRLIENVENLGSAKGCNQGIKAAIGEYIMLLNSDLVVSEGWMPRLLECLLSRQDTGIVGPVIADELYPQTTSEMHLLRDKYRHRRIEAKDVDGFCMLFRRELSNEIGLLDEELASNKYAAEDYCLRARLEGYGNLIAGDVFVRSMGTRDASIEARGKNAYYEKWSGIDADSALGKKLLAVKALGMADEFSWKGETEKAVQVLIEGMQHAPDDARLYYLLLDILIDTKQFKEALEVIERLPADVNDARRLALTGYCKAGMDLSDDADEYADKAQVRDDSSAMALNLKGIVAFKRGDRATASDYFDKAKKADPGYGEPYTNLGVIRWSEGNHAEGLDLLEKGFILSPMSGDSVDAYYSAISQTGSFDRMETTLRDALSLFPSSRRIAFLLIDCLIRQGKDRVAILEIEQSMITYGIDDGMLSAALAVRGKVGAKEIDASKKDANISLCMIVKNEESNLGKCLLNTNALVDEIIVVDTGSTDRTRDIAKSFGAKVYDFEWTHDFSEARNVSLSKSKGDWILVLDADEVISPRDFDALKKLVGRKKRGNAYSITTRNYVDCANVEGWTRNDGFYIMEEAGTGWLPSFKVRLFPNDANIRFENPVHELVEPSLRKAGKKILNCKVPIHHYGKLNSEKCLVKGEAYYQLGRKKLDEQGDEVMPLLELAVQASELEKYEEAVDLLQRLLKLEPNSAKAYFNLGYLYLKLGYYPEGIRSSKRALEIDPNIKEAILNYASCEVYGGDVNNAITALEDMLNKNPGHPSASALLATAYIIGGKVDEGIACIEKIKKMKADCPGVILNHAREFERAGRIDFTLLLLETAVRYGYVNSGILSMLEGLKKR